MQIEHAAVDTAKETLGVLKIPVGDSKAAVDMMQNKADEWIARAKEGTLSRRDVWLLLDRQLWPRVGYGLISNTSHWHKLTDCLKKQCWQLIPLGGVIHTTPDGVHQKNCGFYGVGCPHVGVECFVEQTNKVLMYYGSPSNLGLKMKISLDYMIPEMGILLQPLQESYKKYEQWMTTSWLKSLLEKCDQFDVMVDFNDTPLELPCCGDKWLMREFLCCGFFADEPRRLNRFRIHMQVLFLSYILSASGKILDEKYLVRRKTDEKLSKLNFPKEQPPNKDFTLWTGTIRQVVLVGGIMDRLGNLTQYGHKIWKLASR